MDKNEIKDIAELEIRRILNGRLDRMENALTELVTTNTYIKEKLEEINKKFEKNEESHKYFYRGIQENVNSITNICGKVDVLEQDKKEKEQDKRKVKDTIKSKVIQKAVDLVVTLGLIILGVKLIK